MDSINQQQPETNRRDLSGVDAIARIRETADAAKTCFFCTGGNTGPSRGVPQPDARRSSSAPAPRPSRPARAQNWTFGASRTWALSAGMSSSAACAKLNMPATTLDGKVSRLLL